MGSRAWESDGEQLRYNRLPLESIRKSLLRYGGAIRDITKLTLNSVDYDFQKQAKEGMVMMGKGYSVATFFMPEEVVVFPEMTLSGSNAGNIDVWTPLIPGAVYRVTVNGVNYECIAKVLSVDGFTIIWCGNGRVLGIEEDTGDPFIFASSPTSRVSAFVPTDSYEVDCTVTVTKLENKSTIPLEGAAAISLKEYLYILGYTCYSDIIAWDEFTRKVAEVVAEYGYTTSSIKFEVRHEDATKYAFAGSAVFGTVTCAKDFFKLLHDNIGDEANNTMLTEWLLEDGSVYIVLYMNIGGLYSLSIPMILGRR